MPGQKVQKHSSDVYCNKPGIFREDTYGLCLGHWYEQAVSAYVQGEQCMGLPLASHDAAARRLATSMTLKARPEESQTVQAEISRTSLQRGITTQHGTYSFNVVVTERSRRSVQNAMERHGRSTAGLPASAERPTVLLLHGFLGCAADWDDVSVALALTCRCVSVDLPGHGATVVHAAGVFMSTDHIQ